MTRAVLAALLALAAPAASYAQGKPSPSPVPPQVRPTPPPPALGPRATPAPVEAPQVAAAPTVAAEYRVGAGDVLEVIVLGNDDLSRTPTVQTGGTVTLPLLGEVAVLGLTVPEIKTKLTELLGRDYLVRPQVEVTVKDYQSQFVTVLGEVASPGRKPLRGRTRLVDVLVDAGGSAPAPRVRSRSRAWTARSRTGPARARCASRRARSALTPRPAWRRPCATATS